ncbi:PepSY domain-containing protein [Dietzia sp. ANT_WB102]|uniref:PepSY-associated TM helix domain-containing protein n=1 Tax=Dietzia sp. ANT_WB102 TaxID=2597345 RepID=UPI0011EBA7F4|nr:PepSY domain-containing protein [Dietzia sp. ANT_WB102]KAA0918305.1 PepSY domain-containing protein [Dietzia sp. ANT_WB102]
MTVTHPTARHIHDPGRSDTPQPSRSLAAQLGAILTRVHFYAGLFVAPFLIVAALSGALYAFAPTLEKIVYQEQITAPEASTALPLEQQVNAAQAQFPDLDVAQIWPTDGSGTATRILFADDSLEDGLERAVFVDPATGTIQGDLTSYSGLGELPVRSWISSLHKDLHLGPPGEVYSELAASWLLILALSGLIMWWRKVRSTRHGKSSTPRHFLRGLPARPGTRQKSMSVHATLGTWFTIAILGIAITGLTWSTYAGANIDAVVDKMNWRSDPLQTSLVAETPAAGETSGHQGHSSTDTGSRIPVNHASEVLAVARQAGLDGPVRMFPPADADTAWKVSELWVPWTFSSDAIAIDGSTGQIIDTQKFDELSLYSKLSSWGIHLHMGILFGLPLQIALAATALTIVALAVLGYRMWWKRRPTQGSLPTALGGLTGHQRQAYVIAAVTALAIGAFLPLLGASLAVFLAVDLALTARKAFIARRAAIANAS